MGLFDTIYVSGDVAAAFDLRCDQCGCALPAGTEWQTKSLDPCMCSYYLRHDEARLVRLYLLDRPSDKRFWRPWTDGEITESEREGARGGLLSLLMKRRGEGTFLPEAYLPAHRRQRFMGELPHQWVELYATCSCGAWVERWIKFCDGVAVEARDSPPRHEDGFYDEASELGS